MKKERNESDSIFKLSIKDLLMQIYKKGKAESFKDGAILSFSTIHSMIGALAEATKDRTLSLMYIDIAVIGTHLEFMRDIFIKKFFKEELIKLGWEEESIDVISNALNYFEDFDEFFEDDIFHDQQLLEQINPTIEILPSTEIESIAFDIHRGLQKGYNRAVHEEMPKLMEDFYDNILDALEKESFEDIKEILEAEKLKWHSFSESFP